MNKQKRYGYLPKDAKEATKIAHWLSFREINFKVGKTCGKGKVIIDVTFPGTIEYILFKVLFIGLTEVEYANYWVMREIAH